MALHAVVQQSICIQPSRRRFRQIGKEQRCFPLYSIRFCSMGSRTSPGQGNPLPPLKPYEPVAAFKKAKKRLPKLTGWWKMFDYGDEIP